jgi:tRNA (adenine57-N1/adenine58-N1)-methyltransferase
MRRGPQIIYPKDVGSLIVDGNITNISTVLEIGTGSGALTLFLLLILGKKGMLYSLDSEVKHQYRASKTINRYISTFNKDYEYNLELIHKELIDFRMVNIDKDIDTIITDVPEPWEFFYENKIEKELTWVSYLPSISQVEKLTNILKENKFENIEIKENLERYWIIKDNILRPKNEMVGHTGFIVSARFIA